MRTAFPLACREKRSFQNGTGVASGPFAADPLDAGPRTIPMTRKLRRALARLGRAVGAGGPRRQGASRQVILFRITEVLRNRIYLEKQPVIGTILPLFGGETVHTLSTQFHAKPLSTNMLVACGG